MPVIVYKRQAQTLDFIRQYIQTNGSAPTLRQIATSLGVSSLATVHEHLKTLEEKGLIKRNAGKSRSIEITDSPANSSAVDLQIPILGFIAAGAPLEPYTDPNATIAIPPSFVTGQKRVFVLQVRGESMIEEQIRDGDFVIIEPKMLGTGK